MTSTRKIYCYAQVADLNVFYEAAVHYHVFKCISDHFGRSLISYSIDELNKKISYIHIKGVPNFNNNQTIFAIEEN